MRQLFRWALPLLLAIVLLAYALKDVSFAEIIDQFGRADYSWLTLAASLTGLIFVLRGKRWQQALLALGHSPTTFRTTVAMLSGNIASMVVIGSGELTRCATLQRTDNVPFAHSIGSIVAERVIDMIMLLFILSLVFVLELTRMSRYFAEVTFATPTALLMGLAVVGVAGCLALYGLWQVTLVRQHPFTQKVVRFGQGLWQGFAAIRKLPNPALFVALTLLIQVAGWLGTYVMLQSIETTQSLPPMAALTILAVASLGGLTVPTQGGIGTYHFLVSRVLVLYGLTPEEGVVAATFMHAVGFAIGLVFSSISFIIVPSLVGQRQKAMETVREP